jgi:hypothetical protein
MHRSRFRLTLVAKKLFSVKIGVDYMGLQIKRKAKTITNAIIQRLDDVVARVEEAKSLNSGNQMWRSLALTSFQLEIFATDLAPSNG